MTEKERNRLIREEKRRRKKEFDLLCSDTRKATKCRIFNKTQFEHDNILYLKLASKKNSLEYYKKTRPTVMDNRYRFNYRSLLISINYTMLAASW